jgi:hypothetical protein
MIDIYFYSCGMMRAWQDLSVVTSVGIRKHFQRLRVRIADHDDHVAGQECGRHLLAALLAAVLAASSRAGLVVRERDRAGVVENHDGNRRGETAVITAVWRTSSTSEPSRSMRWQYTSSCRCNGCNRARKSATDFFSRLNAA